MSATIASSRVEIVLSRLKDYVGRSKQLQMHKIVSWITQSTSLLLYYFCFIPQHPSWSRNKLLQYYWCYGRTCQLYFLFQMKYSLLSIAKILEHVVLRPPVILGMFLLDFGEQEIYEIDEDEEFDTYRTVTIGGSSLESGLAQSDNSEFHNFVIASFSANTSVLLWSIDLTENTWVKAVHRWCRYSWMPMDEGKQGRKCWKNSKNLRQEKSMVSKNATNNHGRIFTVRARCEYTALEYQ